MMNFEITLQELKEKLDNEALPAKAGRFTGRGNYNLIPSNGKEFWQSNRFEFNSFYVFGLGIYPKDMVWDGSFKIINEKTGDSIEFVKQENS